MVLLCTGRGCDHMSRSHYEEYFCTGSAPSFSTNKDIVHQISLKQMFHQAEDSMVVSSIVNAGNAEEEGKL